MITKAIMDFFETVLHWFWSVIPTDWAPPGWVTGTAQAVVDFVSSASSLQVWFPLPFALTCAYAIISTYIGGGAVKAVRIVISHFTGGGGSAA